jgi:CDGSH-type Zn-finger protein
MDGPQRPFCDQTHPTVDFVSRPTFEPEGRQPSRIGTEYALTGIFL